MSKGHQRSAKGSTCMREILGGHDEDKKSSRVRIRKCNEFVFIEDYVGYLQFIELSG